MIKPKTFSEAIALVLQNNPLMTSLNLRQLRLTDKDVNQLCIALAQNSTLTTLNLSFNNITCSGAKALAQITTLTSLDLSLNKIGSQGAIELAKNIHLTHLDLALNKIETEGAIALAQNRTLHSLDLNSNQIGAEGVEAVSKNKTLCSLNIKFNQIGVQGFNALIKDNSLTSLWVEHNFIGYEREIYLKNIIQENRKIILKLYLFASKRAEENKPGLHLEILRHIMSFLLISEGHFQKINEYALTRFFAYPSLQLTPKIEEKIKVFS